VCLEPSTADGATGRLEWLVEPYRESHLDGACLAIAAATPSVNRAVVADAKRRGLWVNAAGGPATSDFVLPAMIRHGDFVLAIGTGGAAPNLAQRVREQLELAFDKAFGEWVELLGELRPQVRDKFPNPARRAAIYQALCDWAWLEQIRDAGIDAVRLEMYASIDRWAAEPMV
jgi:siroheme synthase-like protein